jgi:hypothetical protein
MGQSSLLGRGISDCCPGRRGAWAWRRGSGDRRRPAAILGSNRALHRCLGWRPHKSTGGAHVSEPAAMRKRCRLLRLSTRQRLSLIE